MYFISTEKYNFDTMQELILEINFEFLLMQKPPIVNPFEGGFRKACGQSVIKTPALRRAKEDFAIVKFKEGVFFFFNMPGKSESAKKNVNQKGTHKRKIKHNHFYVN